jgi:hypothetical protein
MVDGREFLPPFMVAQNESTFRDHQHGSNNHCLQQHSLQTFNSMDMDGILSIKLKHMIAGMFFSKSISFPPAGNKHPSSRKQTSLQLNPLCDQSMASFHKLYWALDHV